MDKTKTSNFRLLQSLALASHDRDIHCSPFREKPDLNPKDVVDRRACGEKYVQKPETFWFQNAHLTIDVKYFKIYTNRSARSRSAKEAISGSFGMKAQCLLAHLRPSKRRGWNPGACGVHVLAGAGSGRDLLWQYIDDRRWLGSVAAVMYKGTINGCLERTYLGRSFWTILEDTDPTGFRFKAGAKPGATLYRFQGVLHNSACSTMRFGKKSRSACALKRKTSCIPLLSHILRF